MKNRIGSIILLILSILLVVGEQTFGGPCGPKPNGGFMTCHWAGQAVLGVGIVLVILSLLHVVSKNHCFKQGLNMGIILNALLVICIPGHLINLCMMNYMMCHTVMKPFVTVIGALLVIAAVVDFFIRRKELEKENQKEGE